MHEHVEEGLVLFKLLGIEVVSSNLFAFLIGLEPLENELQKIFNFDGMLCNSISDL